MGKPLVIVESPTKARTIERFLGKDFQIEASVGHVRDLPNNAAEIPEQFKKQPWARIGVNVENGFEPLYVVPESKKKRVKELKGCLKDAPVLYLATDEDREGESISWHLVQLLNPKIPIKRLVFHEITKDAIQKALESPREVNENLVRAQETRRIIDRLFGYTVSPLLWKKMLPRLSAGRVQSVAIRLLVQRERERLTFKPAVYWDLKGIFRPEVGDQFEAELLEVRGKRVAQGKDFDPLTGKVREGAGVVVLNSAEAEQLRDTLLSAPALVDEVEEKPFTTKPYPPFTTSTLQQEASRKFRFPARRTMSVAQTLYENGFITYMRTDSTNLSEEAIQGARSIITSEFGANYLPSEPRLYKTQVKNAQEAHEAIRPAGSQFAHPSEVNRRLGPEAGRLYELIWKRMLACQMKDAVGTRATAQIACGDTKFRATGKTIQFPGFLRAYVEGADDPEAELADREKILPPLKKGQDLTVVSLDSQRHETQPPPRYTEGSLIKELERRGIGRPSTWATIVEVVLSRTYAFRKGTALVPTFLATAVTSLMEGYFSNLVDYEFTARMEDDLDAISRGEKDSLGYLNNFYFGNGHPGLKTLVSKGEQTIDPRLVCGIQLGVDPTGRTVEVRIGRYGPFLTNGETRAGLPELTAPDELKVDEAVVLLEKAAQGPASIGTHPETGEPIYVKSGMYGPYIQCGEGNEKEGTKPRTASLLPGMKPEDVRVEVAVRLLEFPKTLGVFPDNQQEIIAAQGRYGPYVKAGEETRTVPDDISLLDLTLEQAIAILREPRRRGRGQSSANTLMIDLGTHPVNERPIKVRSGRFGPYVTDGEINATLPKGLEPQAVTLDDAVNLLEERAAKLAEMGDAAPKKGSKAKGSKSKAPSTPKRGAVSAKTVSTKTVQAKGAAQAKGSRSKGARSKGEETTL